MISLQLSQCICAVPAGCVLMHERLVRIHTPAIRRSAITLSLLADPYGDRQNLIFANSWISIARTTDCRSCLSASGEYMSRSPVDPQPERQVSPSTYQWCTPVGCPDVGRRPVPQG